MNKVNLTWLNCYCDVGYFLRPAIANCKKNRQQGMKAICSDSIEISDFKLNLLIN